MAPKTLYDNKKNTKNDTYSKIGILVFGIHFPYH